MQVANTYVPMQDRQPFRDPPAVDPPETERSKRKA